MGGLIVNRINPNEWSEMDLNQRKSVLKNLINYLIVHESKIISAQINDICMPISEAKDSFSKTIDRLNWFIDNCEENVILTKFANGLENKTIRVPYGVVLIITPYNHPVAIPLWQIVPCLLAGNSVIWKPSDLTPKSNYILKLIFD